MVATRPAPLHATFSPATRRALYGSRTSRAKALVKEALVTHRGLNAWDNTWGSPRLSDEYNPNDQGRFLDAYVSVES